MQRTVRPSAVDLPESVRLDEGDGGLALLRVATSEASAEIYLHGAHVSSWAPAGEGPVLWMSRTSELQQDAPIRGGVPVCFPWFGAGRDAQSSPVHGFARLASWTLASAIDLDGAVTLTFRLTDSDVGELPAASAWTHPFELTYVVTVATELMIALTVRNTGDEAFSFEEALHAYLAVGDIGSVTVENLAEARYVDRASGVEELRGPQAAPVTFTEETDRVYFSAAGTKILDPHGARSIEIAKYASANTVVWNPWRDKAAAIVDFDADGWRSMVCVEPANVRAAAIDLQPGAAHTMATTFTVTRALGR